MRPNSEAARVWQAEAATYGPAECDEPCPACGYPQEWVGCDHCPPDDAHPECPACGGDGGWWQCEWCEMTALAAVGEPA